MIRSVMEGGGRLVWLVLGTSLAAVGATAFKVEEKGPLVLLSLAWTALFCCIFRPLRWARWTAAVIFALVGTVFTLGTASLWLVRVLGTNLPIVLSRVPRADFVGSLIGPMFVVDAAVLIFSEGVGDFFAGATGDWSQLALAARRGHSAPSRNRIELVTARNKRKLVIRRARLMTVGALALSWMIFLAGVAWNLQSLSGPLLEVQALNSAELELVAQSDVPILTAAVGLALLSRGAIFATQVLILSLEILLFGYILLFFMPFVLTMPFVLPFARKWHNPVKFLVLRPFNKNHITASLAQFLLEEFAPFGHCYTLSDRTIRVPFHVRIAVLWGQLSFFNFRVRKIRRPQHIEKLVKAMEKSARRNLNWCFSRSKLFPISCCDPGWQACVTRLVWESDVVVADLSSITQNIAWELELLRSSGALEKTVFVVERSQAAEAQQTIKRLMELSIREMPLLPYGQGGTSTGDAAGSLIIDTLCRDAEQKMIAAG